MPYLPASSSFFLTVYPLYLSPHHHYPLFLSPSPLHYPLFSSSPPHHYTIPYFPISSHLIQLLTHPPPYPLFLSPPLSFSSPLPSLPTPLPPPYPLFLSPALSSSTSPVTTPFRGSQVRAQCGMGGVSRSHPFRSRCFNST
ncbi:hypothetical protein Pmani_039292 [Petrolisthes manimaculis]|uniref:Uncharacterized protein n=1 Tax=Petrolisthes manimaculis TaxID=1843537 RepID=A0AAE1NFB9_9EUCA|nr:hypothetical protein Pmani_039292 [Petrolisthes manimaculis]